MTDSNSTAGGGGAGVAGAIRELKRRVPAPMRGALRRTRRAASYVPRRLFGTITQVRTQEPAVALTFDDGPHPIYTPQFLERLEARGARATFFLLGQSAARHPELVERIAAGGHAIGNHSWDHPSFPAVSGKECLRQIRACGQALGSRHAGLFRPPYGDQTFLTRLAPMVLGWKVVTWNVAGNDWSGDCAADIAQRILARLQPGSIVLLHERLFRYEDPGFAAREATLQAVSMVLDAASRFRFVTVPELLRLGRPNRELWRKRVPDEYLARLSGES